MKKLPLIAVLFTSFVSTVSFAGAGSSGGGDSYVLDFVATANQIVYPWLIKNEKRLNIKINKSKFLDAINPKKILSIDHVYESCDGSNSGREVEACYSADTEMIYLSRTKYRTNDNSPSKLGIVAHEIFRKLDMEGDDYKITKNISISSMAAVSYSSNGANPDGSITFNNPKLFRGDQVYAIYSNHSQSNGQGICAALGFDTYMSEYSYSYDGDLAILNSDGTFKEIVRNAPAGIASITCSKGKVRNIIQANEIKQNPDGSVTFNDPKLLRGSQVYSLASFISEDRESLCTALGFNTAIYDAVTIDSDGREMARFRPDGSFHNTVYTKFRITKITCSHGDVPVVIQEN